jgi:7,8-dihydropterin-6-yl-methyl-4-(beta-D-ribofuranosyl)aminobenzene 5'-phosphate synthase
MEIKITNIYTNEQSESKRLKNDHGQAFIVTIADDNILIDTGTHGSILLHNMKELGISPNSITKILLTHGHYDHCGGLPKLLDAVHLERPIPVYAHPNITEKKIFKLERIKKDIGFPQLSKDQKNKIDLKLTNKPVEFFKRITSTGEISNRPHRDGKEPNAMHKIEDGSLEADPVLDDQSLVINTKEGVVVLTGCCHAGLLNTLKQIKKKHDNPIKAVIGGTHMVRFRKEEVDQVADILEKEYETPNLYLNHCTDNLPKILSFIPQTKATKILQNRLGEEKVKLCPVGTELTFEM